MQDDKESVQYLKAFAVKQDSKLLELLMAYEEEYKVYENLDLIEQIQNRLKVEKNNYGVSELKYARLVQSAFILEQFAIFDANLGNRSIHRDSSMANNLLWILDNYDMEKAVFWADNYHVKKKERDVSGGYLAKALQEKYFVIGMHLAKGSTRGRIAETSKIASRLIPSKPEYFLNAAEDSIYFLSAEDFCDKFNMQERIFESMEELCELNYYDAIIHIKNASPAIEIE